MGGTGNRALVVIIATAALIVGAWVLVAGRSQDALVVYCAHDLVYSQQVLDDFAVKTGLNVEVLGDSEAAKSLGLVQRLLREKEHPHCDVLWNNEPLGTLSLQKAGVLAAYRSPEFDQRPPEFQSEDGTWAGFGVRFRVWIVNTEKMPATREAVEERMKQSDLSRMAVAVPLYGTTLTHYSLMWDRWGADRLKEWHRSLKDRGCQFLKGNGAVKDVVASGVCEFGLTDTDDFYVAKDAGLPVAMIPARVEGRVVAIPNTASVIRGTKHRAAAEKLVDFLLSAENDVRLSKSGSRQVPVHLGVTPDQISSEAAEMLLWTKDASSLSGLEPAREACLDWLQSEFAP
jgi:iron(III) transport system substrate-binding protein